MKQKFSRFAGDCAGGAALLFALAAPGMIGVVGSAVDYAAITQQQTMLTNATDSAALALGRQMTLSPLSDSQAQAIAATYLKENLGVSGLSAISVSAKMSADRMSVKVEASGNARLTTGVLGLVIGQPVISAGTTARLGNSQAKLCLLSINKVVGNEGRGSGTFNLPEKTGINLMKDSRLTAPGCLLHTNVSTEKAMSIGSGAKVSAGLLCAVGGIKNSGGSIEGTVLDSCPALVNPMEKRFYPDIGQDCRNATYRNIVHTSGIHIIKPGNYCGNFEFSGTARVTLLPGTFAIQGTLIVKGNAELTGSGVGLYLWGGNGSTHKFASFSFLENALISLTAPETGPMAGMLIWEGVNGAVEDLNHYRLTPVGSWLARY